MRIAALRAFTLSSLFVIASSQSAFGDDAPDVIPDEYSGAPIADTQSIESKPEPEQTEPDSIASAGENSKSESAESSGAESSTIAEHAEASEDDSCGGGDTPGAALPGGGSANISGGTLNLYTPTLSELTGYYNLSLAFGFDANLRVNFDINSIFDPEKFCNNVTVIAEGKVGVPGVPGANLGFEYNFQTQEWEIPFKAEFKTNWGPDIIKLLEDYHIKNQ